MNITAKKLSVICCLLLFSASGLAVPEKRNLTNTIPGYGGNTVSPNLGDERYIYKKIITKADEKAAHAQGFTDVWVSKRNGFTIEENEKKMSEVYGKNNDDPFEYNHSVDRCKVITNSHAKGGSACVIADHNQECALTEIHSLNDTELVRVFRWPESAGGSGKGQGDWYIYTEFGPKSWVDHPHVSYNCWTRVLMKADG